MLHPSLISELPPSPTIVNTGTGTEIFLTQLAKIYPDAVFHGFDISPALFPTAEHYHTMFT